jgi:hypothetical protein
VIGVNPGVAARGGVKFCARRTQLDGHNRRVVERGDEI